MNLLKYLKNMPTKDEIQKFSVLIEKLAIERKCDRLDAIVIHCDETGLEIEVASTLISTALKSKIQEEAQRKSGIILRYRMKIAVLNDTHCGARNASDVFLDYFAKFYSDVFFPYCKQNGITQIIHLGD